LPGEKKERRFKMANLIVICAREATDNPYSVDDVRRCVDALVPDNIEPRPPLIYEQDGVVVAVANPVPEIPVHNGCVCLGRFFGPAPQWWETGSAAPDGSFAIVRHDERHLELLTDILATRSVWFVHTKRFFLASTSQRALVALLGSFELNDEAVTWMLTSAHLGAGSWDARLRRLPGDNRLVLDRQRWEVRIHQRPAVREALAMSDAEHIDRLRLAILDTCAQLDLPMDEWLLPLSGGLDSRSVLLGLLHAGIRPRCVTWGLPSSLQDAQNDARIAPELAKALGVEHRYCPIDYSSESVEKAVHRFVQLSEGQTCDFGGYADGMGVWKHFFEDGVTGVIRGDEPGIGYTCDRDSHDDTEWRIMRRDELVFLADYSPGHPIRQLGLVEQSWDDSLRRQPQESLTAWNMRLFEDVTSPATRAPGTAVKGSYVEVVNPLQSRQVVEVARRLPDHLQVHRKSLRAVVRSLGPDVPFAKTGANGPAGVRLQTDEFRAVMVRALSSDSAELVLRRPALDTVLAALREEKTSPMTVSGGGLRSAVKAVVPGSLVDKVRPVPPMRLSGQQLAFRTFVAVEMAGILTRAAATLGTRSVT
jgi:asparagine synthetase B (glutamine-hydrolysing)